MKNLLDDKMRKMLENVQVREGTYFITGATGFIGHYIALSLLYLCEYQNLNIKVIIAVRNKEKAEALFQDYLHKNYFEVIIQDMTEEYKIQNKMDYIIHAAVKKHVTHEDSYSVFSENILATRNILLLANEKRVKRVLLISTCSVYGDLLLKGITDEKYLGGNDSMKAGLCYAESKRASEYMFASGLEQFSLYGSIVRLFSVYGPGMDIFSNNVFSDLFRQALSQKTIVIKGTGKGVRNFSYISDVVYGIFSVLYCGESGKAYNVGTKNANVSILTLAEKLRECSHRKIEIKVNNQFVQKDRKESIQAPEFDFIESIAAQPETSLEEGIDRMFSFYINDTFE